MARYIRYKKLKQQINFLNCDELDKWEDTCNYRLSDYLDVCDGYCNCSDYGEKEPILQYRWNVINPNYGYYCENNDRYYKLRREVSYDDGKTWYYTIPEEFQKGELYEENSRFCTSDKVMFEYREDFNSEPFCERYNKMQKFVKCVSFDGGTNWEVLTWNKPDGTVFKEYKTMLIEENACDCGYKNYRFLFNDEYVCGQDLRGDYQDKYSYEVWREYETCSNTPTGRIEYRNPQPSCDCGFTGTEFVFSGTYVCGSDIEISGLTITEVHNGNIMDNNNIQTSGITFGENLDVRIKFTLQEKSNVKFDFQFSEGSNVFMMENIDTYGNFVNPLVNMNTGSYNCEFTNLSVGEHHLWLRLNNQSNTANTITLTSEIRAYSTEYDRTTKYEYWYEKDVCTGIATGRFEYRNPQPNSYDCGYVDYDYVFDGEYVCGADSDLIESYHNGFNEYGYSFENGVIYVNRTSSASCTAEFNYIVYEALTLKIKTVGDYNYSSIDGISIKNKATGKYLREDGWYDEEIYLEPGQYLIKINMSYRDTSRGSKYIYLTRPAKFLRYEKWEEIERPSNHKTGKYELRNATESEDCGFNYSMKCTYTASTSYDSSYQMFNKGECFESGYCLETGEITSIGKNYNILISSSAYNNITIYLKDVLANQDFTEAFFNTRTLHTVELYDNLNKKTSFNSAFMNCSRLSVFKAPNVNTAFVTDVSKMFYNCTNLNSIDVSNWYIDNITSMQDMFYKCNSLTHIKCTQKFKDWCIEHQDEIQLPYPMKEGGKGTWEIIS